MVHVHHTHVIIEIVSAMSEFLTLQQEITSEPKALISLTNLNPNTEYVFRIIAINNHGISQPSVASDVLVTPSFGQFTLKSVSPTFCELTLKSLLFSTQFWVVNCEVFFFFSTQVC